MEPLLLTIDQGTTSTRAMVFTVEGDVVATGQKELGLHCPAQGWVEQDPEAIWTDTLEVCRAALEAVPGGASRIAAASLTNQRETTILWDRQTGRPLYNAIVWQDRRTAEICAALKRSGAEPDLAQRTGLVPDPYFSATKIGWILDHVEGARRRAERGEIAFGTVDSFLLWRLTGGQVHATDATNASRTALFNLRTQSWDPELLRLFAIPQPLLPDVRDTVADFGATQNALFGRPIPLRAVAGDQHAAMAGQACFAPGMVKATYGTGCFALMNAGPRFALPCHGLLTTMAWRLNGQPVYAMEGSIFSAGAAVQWLRDGLGLVREAAQTEALARSVPDSGGVYMVPAFTGLGSPYWEPEARGALIGLTRDTGPGRIARAALEAQGYQSRDLFAAMEAASGARPAVVRADGGLVANGFVCQFVADMIGCALEVPAVAETTALGAAFLAGMGAGIYGGPEDIARRWRCGRRYDPAMPVPERDRLYAGWKRAVGAVRNAAGRSGA